MANAGKGMGQGRKGGTQHVGPTPPDDALDQDDLASEIKGRNKLQGNDQRNVRDERHAVPRSKHETEGVVEGLERRERKQGDQG